MPSTVPRLGLIADTHNFLDPVILDLFAGVTRILHAGDIGQPRVIAELERVAPVTAVGGNTDDPGFGWRETEVLTLHGRKVLLHHIVNPRAPAEALARRLRREAPDVVVFGHTHQPFEEVIGGVLFLNPGSAGRARFHLPRSVAILHLEPKALRVEFCELGA
jgi:putative phosphoesterase